MFGKLAPEEITRHVTICDRVANLLERSKLYVKNGPTTADYLRELSKLLYEAGDALREMFVEIDSVHRIFNVEVNAMIRKIRSIRNFFFQDPEHFKKCIKKLEITMGKFENIVSKAMEAIMKAKRYR